MTTTLDVTDAFWFKCLRCGRKMTIDDMTKQAITLRCDTAGCQCGHSALVQVVLRA